MRRRRASAGFTLVELLIALALSTVGLLGLLSLQFITVRGNMSSRNFIEAVGLAQERLEAAQVVSYANLPTLTATEPTLTANNGAQPGGQYTRQTTVNVNAASTDIVVDVSWADADNPTVTALRHHVQMNTTRSP